MRPLWRSGAALRPLRAPGVAVSTPLNGIELPSYRACLGVALGAANLVRALDEHAPGWRTEKRDDGPNDPSDDLREAWRMFIDALESEDET